MSEIFIFHSSFIIHHSSFKMFNRRKSIYLALCSVLVGLVTLLSQARWAEKTALAQTDGVEITHGPISGEVTANSVMLWARGNITGTLIFEVAETAEFSDIVATAEAEVQAANDFTGKSLIDKLQPNTPYFYRVTLATDDSESNPIEGQFKTAPTEAAPFSFVFGACLGGQGNCRDAKLGWPIFSSMAAQKPDFFLLTGDTIYASGSCPTPANVAGAETPAQDLSGFRARYRYNLGDEKYAAFLAQTPVYVTWDDHEVRDDYGAKWLSGINPQRLADGRQAFFEYWPITPSKVATDTYHVYRSFSYGAQADFFVLDTRSYRDPNVNWDPNPRTLEPKTMLGAEQFAWLQKSLAASKAKWKFIVTSVLLSYPTGFPQPEVDGRDGWANFTEKSGYETELLALVFYLQSQPIKNVVFLTGDTHWPFAISYDPDRNGQPNFYEFASSPLSAIVLAPAPKPDPTLNPTVLYAEGEFQGTLFNFGQISVTATGDLTFRILDRDGKEHYTQTITAN